eukprot:NODE_7984_length_429_cov_36.186842_g7124_i0.p2 GENE.NODE_7984_length_429_cov_36.186842_g7124_i0~~NODE_7984_length_429_cov_36.186842_g7124_i0.p2  ORF type:complete len:92 (-),score=3.38 NODE_7984_length_429_cov_36.186842_g7124_i0:99-374(-)
MPEPTGKRGQKPFAHSKGWETPRTKYKLQNQNLHQKKTKRATENLRVEMEARSTNLINPTLRNKDLMQLTGLTGSAICDIIKKRAEIVLRK